MVQYIIKSWSEWRKERKAISELSSMNDRDLADLGISRCDIPALVRGSMRKSR
jgi:uncharacterized protein YjiS (DUF1127 family)